MTTPIIERPTDDDDNLDIVRRAVNHGNLKPLTHTGHREARTGERTAGKVWCFAPFAVPREGRYQEYPPFRLAIAIANEPGFLVLHGEWCNSTTYEAMEAYAEQLNGEMGMIPAIAAQIITSTYRRPQV